MAEGLRVAHDETRRFSTLRTTLLTHPNTPAIDLAAQTRKPGPAPTGYLNRDALEAVLSSRLLYVEDLPGVSEVVAGERGDSLLC